MNVLIVGANNVVHAKEYSTSLRASLLVSEILMEQLPQAKVKMTSLVDLDLRPCIMCGDCQTQWDCIHDEDYNMLLSDMRDADAIFFVIPHYAPIPSKISIVLEKLQQMAFSHSCLRKRFFLSGKVAAIVAHGGSPKEHLAAYRLHLLDPVSTSLKSVGMKIVGVGSEWPNGVAFGVIKYEPQEDSIFPHPVHDWDDARETIAPLVNEVVYTLCEKRA